MKNIITFLVSIITCSAVVYGFVFGNQISKNIMTFYIYAGCIINVWAFLMICIASQNQELKNKCKFKKVPTFLIFVQAITAIGETLIFAGFNYYMLASCSLIMIIVGLINNSIKNDIIKEKDKQCKNK